MKIAYYVPSWPPGKAASGIVTYAAQIIPALRDLGHEVFVITPTKADDDPHTVDLSAFAYSPSIWARAADKFAPGTVTWRAVAFAIRSAVRSLVHARGIEIFEIEETFGVSLPLSRLRLLPVAVRLHGPWFLTGAAHDERTRHDLRRQRLEGVAIQSATLVNAPTKEILRAVRGRYPAALSDVCVIPNSLKAADEQTKWRFESCDPSNILFVGRFDQKKGGDLALRVFAKLASVYPQVTLTFVGPDLGVNGPDNKLQSFHNFVHSDLPESCRSRIEFRGQVAHSKLASLRRKSFLTIVASQYETMPYAVLEAMSLGCPIVAPRVGGIPEMIDDGRSGLLVPSKDPDSMAEACGRLLDSPAFAASLGHQAWNKCREFYNPITVAEQTIRAYQSALTIFKSHA